jgi:Domain of unknown function (DUF4265)
VTQRGSLADEGFVKIKMSGPDGTVETLWAVRVTPDRFRLDNLPFYAYGVSLGDIVEGEEYVPGMYDLVKVVEPSGNRLMRVILAADAKANTAAGKLVIDRLHALGCDL